MATQELIRNTTVAVGVTPVVISEEQDGINSERTVLFIVNTSTAGQKITISPLSEAQLDNGIVLAVGGYYQDSKDSGYKPTNTRITAISDVAAGQVSIHERIQMRVD